MNADRPVLHVVGGGLAGAEAAWQAAHAGARVVLHEMRPDRETEVHKTDGLAELVCSNSFRSDDYENNAVGLLHEEMRRAGSVIMAAADANKVPAGSALAVDRDGFSARVGAEIEGHDLITVERGEVDYLPPDWRHVIIATGPLTSPALSAAIQKLTGEDELAFFDAIAPIVYKDTIDFDTCWFQSRYDKTGPGGTGADYINCPLDEDDYRRFVAQLLEAETVSFHEWEGTPYFEGCLPIEVMAARGPDVLRHGPMKPVGLTNPHRPEHKPHAVVQLRQDNALGTLYNMVGFQTKMKYGAQNEVLRLIPGLEKAQFARLGGLHRNTFLNSPKVLTQDMRLKADKRLRFAGQITGVEGYVESAAMGLLAGRFAAGEIFDQVLPVPPATTAIGALLAHITGGHIESVREGARSFQPMNINFGLFPPVEASGRGRKQRRLARRQALSARALNDVDKWLSGHDAAAA